MTRDDRLGMTRNDYDDYGGLGMTRVALKDQA